MTREFVIRAIVPFRCVSLTKLGRLRFRRWRASGEVTRAPSSPSLPPTLPAPAGQCRSRRRASHTRPCVVVVAVVVIVLYLYDRYRKYQRHGLLGSLLLVNGKPVRSQWVNESTGARECAREIPTHLSRLDRVRENRSRRGTHTRIRGVPKPPNILLRPLPAAHAEIIISS